MRIDVHAHYNPAALAEATLRFGGQKPMGPAHPDDLQPRLDAMAEAKVETSVLWPTFQPDLPEAGAARDFARLTNDLYREKMSVHGRAISAWGAVPLPHVDFAIEEAVRCLDELGMAGIGLGCSIAGSPLDSPAFHPFWEEMDRRGAVVFLHPGQVGGCFPGGSDFALGPCLCSPAEIGIAGARLVLSGLTEKFANVRFVLATGGGALPYAVGKMEIVRNFMPDAAPFRGDLRQELARFYYDTSFPEEPTKLLALSKVCPIDHIVFGSDQPFGSVQHGIASIEQASFLSDDDKRAILDLNAAKLLGASHDCSTHRG